MLSRVTRSGEFWPFWRFFTLGKFLKMIEGHTFLFHVPISMIIFNENELGYIHFRPFFSQLHLVALVLSGPQGDQIGRILAFWAILTTNGWLFTVGSCQKITKNHAFLANFFHGYGYALTLTKMYWGTNSSGRPGAQWPPR
jgi:hypothetical protein